MNCISIKFIRFICSNQVLFFVCTMKVMNWIDVWWWRHQIEWHSTCIIYIYSDCEKTICGFMGNCSHDGNQRNIKWRSIGLQKRTLKTDIGDDVINFNHTQYTLYKYILIVKKIYVDIWEGIDQVLWSFQIENSFM